ncbi:MAG TPA: sigma-70 family RNA polymerase sigma factor [Propionibacteriaceae bacterium]|nr:sigma-70 family RNA polymerase sigma factor [Propionibacteriaceae bacterium]
MVTSQDKFDEGELEATGFERERPRLRRLATRVLGDPAGAEDVVQQAWLRLHAAEQPITNLPAWLTTVTTRLCLDHLRARVPVPAEVSEEIGSALGPEEEVMLADSVGVALQVVLDRLTPTERVAFVMHDSFGFDFTTIAAALDTTPTAARKLASRARAKVRQPAPEDTLAAWEVVDAFMAAAREGDFDRLLELLAPGAGVRADRAAVSVGTPERIDGAHEIATFFNGSAHAALAVFAGDRPAAAWYDRGRPAVLFDFVVVDGRVERITFRADPASLAEVVRREGPDRRRRAEAGHIRPPSIVNPDNNHHEEDRP